MGATCGRYSSFALYLKYYLLLNLFHSFFFRCKMLSHLAFVCSKEVRPCPLYAVGCTEVHSLADSDSSSHFKLLLKAGVSGACGVSLCSNDLVIKYPSMNIPFNKYFSLHMSSCNRNRTIEYFQMPSFFQYTMILHFYFFLIYRYFKFHCH